MSKNEVRKTLKAPDFGQFSNHTVTAPLRDPSVPSRIVSVVINNSVFMKTLLASLEFIKAPAPGHSQELGDVGAVVFARRQYAIDGEVWNWHERTCSLLPLESHLVD